MNHLYSKYLKSTGVCTDTRDIHQGAMFFALKGDVFNGNLFAAQALEKGAQWAVVDDPGLSKHPNFIQVEDVLQSLQDLAKYHRHQFNIPIIGITGTNGKTTSKELIASVLSKKFNTQFTKGNLNNHIGVPLTLLEITASTEIAIIEMGANHPGEIAFLSAIADPDYGMITNIGKAHLEGFGGYQGVIKTKTELYNHIKQKKGILFVNDDDSLLKNLSHDIECVYYGSETNKIKLINCSSEPFLNLTLSIDGRLHKISTQLIGKYNIPNILAAICMGNYFGIDTELIAEALSNYIPGNMRSQFKATKSNKIIVDAYNANPSSMEVALQNFGELESPNKALIIGEMLELGTDSDAEHQLLIQKLLDTKAKQVFIVGNSFKSLNIPVHFQYFDTTESLKQHLVGNPIQNMLILLKGSRGNKLEKLLDVL
jgi:UDP-N-acetylmuramoyl-tripeptide--D-alanyl-D-alanine ligase